MEILGYIGFVALIFLAVTWTIAVRVQLGIGVPSILGALFFLVAAIALTISGANKIHSFWIIPAGFGLTLFVALLSVHVPIVFGLFRLVASAFAVIVRVGIPEEKIKAALEADLRAAVARWREKNDA